MYEYSTLSNQFILGTKMMDVQCSYEGDNGIRNRTVVGEQKQKKMEAVEMDFLKKRQVVSNDGIRRRTNGR